MKTTIEKLAKRVAKEGYAPVLLHPEVRRLCELVRADERARMAEQPAQPAQPAQRTWVALTDEEIIDVIHPLVMADMPDEATDYEIARAIEAKLRSKNT